MTPPTNKKELQSFLRMCGYYRTFIAQYSQVTAPLTDLLSEKNPYSWKEKQDVAFQTLKQRLSTSPILIFPNFTKTFYVFSDASDRAVGAVLCQEINNRFHPIAYASKKLNPTQLNYAILKKEALALKFGLEHFKTIIYGFPIICLTDHRPLVSIFGKQLPKGALGRWVLAIMAYRMTIKYLSGKQNTSADALSRMPVQDTLDNAENLPIDQDHLEEGVYCMSAPEIIAPTTDKNLFKRQTLQNAQKKDKHCQLIVRTLQGKVHPTSQEKDLQHYLLDNGLLLKRRILKRVDQHNIVLNIAVPDDLMKEVIAWCHRSIGHAGTERTLQAFKRYFCSSQEERMVKEFCKSCEICIKANGRPAKVPLRRFPVDEKPWSHVGLDLVGPLPITERGNRYLAVIVDMATRFCLIEAIPNKSGQIVAETIRSKVFKIFGSPQVILTDNGTEFRNEIFNALCDLYQTSHRTTCAYHPASNGLVERTNGQIGRVLRTVLLEKGGPDWDETLSEVNLSINTTYNRTIGDTSHYALFGYDPRGPVEELEEVGTRVTWAQDEARKRRLAVLRAETKKAIEQAAEQSQTWTNKKRKDKDLREDDRVFIKNHTPDPGRKLAAATTGPYLVREVTKRGKILVEDLLTHKQKHVHEDHVIRAGGKEPEEINDEPSKNNPAPPTATIPQQRKQTYNLRSRK